MLELYGTPVALVAEPPRDFRFEAASVTDDGFAAASLRFTGPCRSGTESFPDVIVAHAASGHHRWQVGRETGAGSVPFVIPPDRDLRVEFHGLHIRTLRIDPDLIRRSAQALTGAEPTPLRHDRVNGEARHPGLMAEALRFVEATIVADASLGDAPLVRAQIIQQTVASVLTAFPLFDLVVRPTPGTSRTVRRAVRYMEEHMRDAVTVADIAIAVGVSTRTLQAAFHRHLETSPSQYLRSLRLRAARDELRDSVDPKLAVRDVARRWGFEHAGRFAQVYAAEYGERPSDTLRR